MPPPIGPDDVVTVQGKYLVKLKDGSRFLMRGLAFPKPLIVDEDDVGYDEDGWIAILEQLHSLQLEINTIRLYLMDPSVDYSAFLNKAAELGIYVVVPLTGVSGHGVLDRNKAAPTCYREKLYQYGVGCLENYGAYPNVLGGMIANEVMNSEDSWLAAPCIAAYARDLSLYIQHNLNRPFPLMYAAQHDSIGAAVLPAQVMKLTLDYLTCHANASIDVFGINVESWCSSLQTFEQNEDDSVGSYYELYQTLHNASIPLVFSEMGCSKHLYNRDNGLPRYDRDWAQIPVVLGEMADVWSGFCAYAYYGNPLFQMTKGGPWNGHDPLTPTQDFYNFRDQLLQDNMESPSARLEAGPRPSCEDVHRVLEKCCDLHLYEVDRMPSYFTGSSSSVDKTDLFIASTDATLMLLNPSSAVEQNDGASPLVVVVGVGAVVAAILTTLLIRRRHVSKRSSDGSDNEEGTLLSQRVTYDSINN